MELGNAGAYLADFLRGFAAVLILDAVRRPSAEPGSLVIERDLGRIRSAALRTRPQDANLAQALDTLAFEGRLPDDLVVIGVVPKQFDAGTGLSPEIEVTLSALAEAAAAELERLECPPRRRSKRLVAGREAKPTPVPALPVRVGGR